MTDTDRLVGGTPDTPNHPTTALSDPRQVAAAGSLTVADLVPQVQAICSVTIPDAVEAFEDDVEPLTYLLRVLQITMDALKDAYQLVEDALVEAMPENEMNIPGVGDVIRRSGTRRTAWDHDGLWADIVQAAIAKLAKNGVQPGDVLPEFINLLRESVSPSWKVTGLRKLGLDPEEYCETSYGRRTIQLPPVPRAEA